MANFSEDQIVAGLERIGLSGARAEVHSSLRSFGYVLGGATTVAAALGRTLDTVLAPTFSYDCYVAPANGDRPARNGIDYKTYLSLANQKHPFDPNNGLISPQMGAISIAVARLPGARRSASPFQWTAAGSAAADLVQDHDWENPFQPVKRLAAMNGNLVLLGVGLTACTALHLAEERSGRRPFIRWAMASDGGVQRFRVGSCSAGFDNLMPYLRDVLHEEYIGRCRVLTANLPEFLNRAADVIRRDPEITMCPRACRRCRDAVAGGPCE